MAIVSRLDSAGNFKIASSGIFDEYTPLLSSISLTYNFTSNIATVVFSGVTISGNPGSSSSGGSGSVTGTPTTSSTTTITSGTSTGGNGGSSNANGGGGGGGIGGANGAAASGSSTTANGGTGADIGTAPDNLLAAVTLSGLSSSNFGDGGQGGNITGGFADAGSNFGGGGGGCGGSSSGASAGSGANAGIIIRYISNGTAYAYSINQSGTITGGGGGASAAAGTVTLPADTTFVKVWCIGKGANGNGSGFTRGSGGGAGGVAYLTYTASMPANRQDSSGNLFVSGILDEVSIIPSNQYAAAFNGTTKYLNTPTSSAFNFSTSNFTIELWAYKNTSSADDLIITNKSGVSTNFAGDWWFDNSSSQIRLQFKNSSSTAYTVSNSGAVDFPVGQWFHIAAVKSGSTITGYLNGVSFGTVTVTGSFGSSTNGIYIGSFTDNSTWAWNGYISNVRIVNGTAVYTQNFIPTKAPLTAISGTSLLTCQNSTIVDNSTNGFAITNTGTVSTDRTPYPSFYAVSFDGATQYISTPSNAAFTFGTGALTMEAWIYQTATSVGAYKVILADGVYGAAGGWTLYSYNNQLNLWKGGSGGVELIAPAGSIPLNTWTHVAWSRNGSDNRIFINGTQVGATTTDSTDFTSTQIYVGASRLATLFFPGYMSNVRVVKGTAVYTSNFTPPTQQLTAIPGTSLLTCQSSTIIDKSTNAFTITNNGTVTTIPASPFTTVRQQFSTGDYFVSGIFDEVVPFDNYSILFDSSGLSQVKMSASSSLNLSGNFTIEMWLYKTTSNQRVVIFGSNINNGNYQIQFNQSGQGSLGIYSAPDWLTVYGLSDPVNTWFHIALVRVGTTITFYQDGVSKGTATSSATYIFSGGSIGALGDYTPGAGNFKNGYISNVRVINGTYPFSFSNITPLTAVSGTVLLAAKSATFIDESGTVATLTPSNMSSGSAPSIASFGPFQNI